MCAIETARGLRGVTEGMGSYGSGGLSYFRVSFTSQQTYSR